MGVGTYDMWAAGRVSAAPLPRDPMEFLGGAFGPLSPVAPMPVDTPADGSERPSPRRFQYPVGWNMPHGQPGDEGLKLASFAHLRTIADAYSVARACIQLRIQEVIGLEWDIVPTKSAEKRMMGDHGARREFEERRAQLVKFWKRPDTDYFDFARWLHAILEDILVVDAPSLYLHPSRVAGKGVLGSDLAELPVLDGTTIRPLLNTKGGVPKPPNPAYAQYLYGVPRVDLLTAMAGDDMEGLEDAKARDYRGDQLLYVPMETRTWTPYGYPSIERALMPAMAGIQRQRFQLDYFAEGSVPSVFISAGENATAAQCRELQDALNAMAGDPAWKHKIIVIPGGGKIDPMRPTALSDAFDDVIMTQMCMAFDVMPMELGISPKTSSTQSPGAANQMAKTSGDINDRKARKPLLAHLASIFNFVNHTVIGEPDARFLWEGLEEGVDEAEHVKMLDQEIRVGLRSVDEARTIRGEQPWGLPLTSSPVFFTPAGPVPWQQPEPVEPSTSTTAVDNPNPNPTEPGTPGDPEGTPAHTAAEETTEPETPEAAKALRELDLLRRRITKGRPLTGWVPQHIHPKTLAGIATGLDQGIPADTLIGHARKALRPTRLGTLEDQLTAQLQGLGETLAEGHTTNGDFLSAATGVLRGGILEAIQLGAQDALTAGKATKPNRGSRYRLYAGRIWGAYEQGYILTLAAIHDGRIRIKWVTEPRPCSLCMDRSLTTYTLDELPGWPGDGGWGVLCEGGPQCRCTLEAVRSTTQSTPNHPQWAAILAAIRGGATSPLVGPLAVAFERLAEQLTAEQLPFLAALAASIIAATAAGNPPDDDQPGDRAQKSQAPTVAGLVIRAVDTDRLLMLQRALCDDDPAAGYWEFPGGHLDPGELPEAGARREWAEETGCVPPDGQITGSWVSRNGVYRGLIVDVPNETQIPIMGDRDQITNPDDPDGDQVEALAWWDPDQLPGNPALRPELVRDLDLVLIALGPKTPEALSQDVTGKAEGVVGDERARHLHHYWTRGEGLARWVDSPHPWTTLYHQLLRYIKNPDKARRTASQWFHDALGIWPGERGGKNPVGPG
jgi:8-oxo-dGTP pyrophosphatase MutT (NUDIX family)